MKSLKCPQCGGNMTINKEAGIITCPYCGCSQMLEKKETPEEQARRVAMTLYAVRAALHRADDEHARQKARRQTTPKFIAWAIVVLVVAAGILFGMSVMGVSFFSGSSLSGQKRTEIEDPFKYLTISFSGLNGQGIVKSSVKNLPTDIEKKGEKGLKFYFAEDSRGKSGTLSNGDTLTVCAESTAYKLGTSTRTYTVEGLTVMLMDTSRLTDEIAEYLHAQALEAGDDFKDGHSDGGDFRCSSEHLCMYILSNENGENCIFDVFKATFTKGDSSADYIWICRFTDVSINENNKLAPVSYSEKKCVGNHYYFHSDGSGLYGALKYYCGVGYAFKTIEECELYLRENYPEMTNIQKKQDE